MKYSWIITALLAGLAFHAHADDSDMTEARHLEESRKTAQEFMQTLGGTLKRQIEAGGIESAIGVCKQVAPALAAQYSDENRIVKRVSLKPRNQDLGTPDHWEKMILEGFDQAQAAGVPATDMEVTGYREDSEGRWFRYMKAIPAQAMCLKCHGTDQDISSGIKALLKAEYPQDKATGYSVGQIRGAISIRQRVN